MLPIAVGWPFPWHFLSLMDRDGEMAGKAKHILPMREFALHFLYGMIKQKCQNTCHFNVIELTSPVICVSSLHHIKAGI
jgi:hypothetical protein